MPVPTVNFTVQSFSFGQVFTSTQANNLQDNGEFNKQWLGASFVSSAAQDHTHNGVDSALISVSTIPSSSVNQAALRTTTGEVSVAGPGASNLILLGGTYGFYPQVREVGAATNAAQIALTL